MRILLIKPCCLLAIAGVCGIFLGCPKFVTAAVIPFAGSFERGASGGAAWSFGHTATSNPVTPTTAGGEGFLQKTGGTVPFAVDARTLFQFTYTDIGAVGLSDGDSINISNVEIGIFD